MIDIFVFRNDVVKKLEDFSNVDFNDGLYWIDVTSLTKEEQNFIGEKFNLHPLTLEDLYNSHVRIKVEEFGDYLFCVFYAIQKNSGFDLIETDFIIGKNFIITNHKTELVSVNFLKSDLKKLESLFRKGLDFIMHRILDEEIDNFFPILETIDEYLEELDQEVISNPSPKILQKIVDLKRDIISIKKVTLPQREKISFLAKQNYKQISKKCVPYIRDIYDHSIRVSDTIDNYREMIGSTFDTYMTAVSNNMNEVMKTLSIIATIALPLSVISGIYGTNFLILPGSGATYGFWGMISAMVLLSIVMLFYFRKRNWF